MIFDAHCADVSVFLPVWSLGGCISALAAGGYTHIHDRTSKQTEEFKPAMHMNDSNFWFMKLQSVIYLDRHILLTFHSHLSNPNKFPHPRAKNTLLTLIMLHTLSEVYILQYYLDTSPNLYIDLCSFLMFGK